MSIVFSRVTEVNNCLTSNDTILNHGRSLRSVYGTFSLRIRSSHAYFLRGCLMMKIH